MGTALFLSSVTQKALFQNFLKSPLDFIAFLR